MRYSNLDQAMRTAAKPRIRYLRKYGIFQCRGQSIETIGISAAQAYSAWETCNEARKAIAKSGRPISHLSSVVGKPYSLQLTAERAEFLDWLMPVPLKPIFRAMKADGALPADTTGASIANKVKNATTREESVERAAKKAFLRVALHNQLGGPRP